MVRQLKRASRAERRSPCNMHEQSGEASFVSGLEQTMGFSGSIVAIARRDYMASAGPDCLSACFMSRRGSGGETSTVEAKYRDSGDGRTNCRNKRFLCIQCRRSVVAPKAVSLHSSEDASESHSWMRGLQDQLRVLYPALVCEFRTPGRFPPSP